MVSVVFLQINYRKKCASKGLKKLRCNEKANGSTFLRRQKKKALIDKAFREYGVNGQKTEPIN